MAKMKTKKAVSKRFKMTTKGTLKRKQARRQHRAWGKSIKQRRHLRKPATVHKTDYIRIKDLFQG